MTQVKTGELLRRYRLAASLTQSELAAKMMYSTSTICRLERGDIPIRQGHVEQFIKALHLPEADSQKLWATYKHDKRAEQGLGDTSVAEVSSAPREIVAATRPEEIVPHEPEQQFIDEHWLFTGKVVWGLTVFVAVAVLATGWFVFTRGTGLTNSSRGWSVRIFESDVWSFVFVNGTLAATYKNDGWVNIERFLHKDDNPNYATFVSLNGPVNGKWDFVIRHNGEIIKTYSGRTKEEFDLSYNHTVRLFSDGTIAPVVTDERDLSTHRWYARVSANDFGFIWINDVLATGAYSSHSGEFGWQDISYLFHDGEINEIRVAVWNFEGSHSYSIEICQNATLVWAIEDDGYTSIQRKVFDKLFVEDQLKHLGDCPLNIMP